MINRRKTKKVFYGNVAVGGDSVISVQSMTTTRTDDIDETVAQISRLETAGCDIVRLAVPDKKAAEALPEILRQTTIPIVADIHFDHTLALLSVQAGVHALRLNPGNIKKEEHVKKAVQAAKERKIPIRVGVNQGGLQESWMKGVDLTLPIEEQFAHAMVNGAFTHIRILEELDFTDIVISLKSSDVLTMINAHRIMASRCEYPFHLGVTEAGPAFQGSIKSAIGIGTLLQEGIGDTIRISLSDDPVLEVKAGRTILQALGIRRDFPEIISCPTCGRVKIDVISLAKKVEKAFEGVKGDLKVAVMGCEVNGPGEAGDADIGVMGTYGKGLLFKNGEIIDRIPEDQVIDRLVEEGKKIIAEKEQAMKSNKETSTVGAKN
ncbi:flavodoxin-dependent (E)-4-hydroxy-3-methylbut-2-enyl-diphosphate synthase [bacterium]|nr:flavodoxin-dependent (E)-4-hydroxy-3-methylbut-2-enyl-diphosphate synthase [bacterium]MCP5462969.1 flavodoxin-dependent (E)-4-hydroxy-3-methylbut-2-enyl-diphosphate synthase [bacterium]